MKSTLTGPAVHQSWERTYRTASSGRLYEMIFDWLSSNSGLATERNILDIGCGMGWHSIRLARRGFNVVAADFSPYAVSTARANVETQGLVSRINVRLEDLENGLSFGPESFDAVLSWGVLMHIPDNERAMSELIRVTKPGGKIVIYENNLFSIHAVSTLFGVGVKAALKRSGVKKIRMGTYGLEYWIETGVGGLVTRHTRMSAMERFFAKRGCSLRHRVAGEFTEFYKFDRWGSGSFFHALNSLWFSAIRIPYLSLGNLLIFERDR